MKVGDLVRGRGFAAGRVALVIKVVSAVIGGDRYLLIQWSGGLRDTLNERLLESVNGSR